MPINEALDDDLPTQARRKTKNLFSELNTTTDSWIHRYKNHEKNTEITYLIFANTVLFCKLQRLEPVFLL